MGNSLGCICGDIVGDIMITIDELNAALNDAGVKVNSATAQCILDIVSNAEQCMIGKGKDDCTIKLAQITAALLLGSNFTGNKTVSGRGVKGLTISYKVESASVTQQGWYNTLLSFGVIECFNGVIPSPVDRPKGFLFVGKTCRT